MKQYSKIPLYLPNAYNSYIKVNNKKGTGKFIIVPDKPTHIFHFHQEFTLPNGSDEK